MKVTIYWHSSSKDPSNRLLHIARSEKKNYHIKLTNRNTIQDSYMHIMLVCYTTKSANFEWLSLQRFLLPSPISGLPCILQPAKAMTTQWNGLLRKELTSTSKIKMGYV